MGFQFVEPVKLEVPTASGARSTTAAADADNAPASRNRLPAENNRAGHRPDESNCVVLRMTEGVYWFGELIGIFVGFWAVKTPYPAMIDLTAWTTCME